MSKKSQSTTQASTEENPGFEQALTELESIVSQMESGQLPLEQSLAAYKRGTELLLSCQRSLAAIEQQIQILNEEFAPTADEVASARRIVAAYMEATAAGRGSISVDGKMIDVPVVIRAEQLLARHAAIEERVRRAPS